jgi:hypothetical protein
VGGRDTALSPVRLTPAALRTALSTYESSARRSRSDARPHRKRRRRRAARRDAALPRTSRSPSVATGATTGMSAAIARTARIFLSAASRTRSGGPRCGSRRSHYLQTRRSSAPGYRSGTSARASHRVRRAALVTDAASSSARIPSSPPAGSANARSSSVPRSERRLSSRSHRRNGRRGTSPISSPSGPREHCRTTESC